MFQSPPHRGIRFNQSHQIALDDAIYGFSPLLIGESGSTSLANADCIAGPPFQSPPHRGIRFNPHGDSCGSLPWSVCFSPLLIGESGSTDKGRLCVAFTIQVFQSPPHRGIRFNLPNQSRSVRHIRVSFSPLLIGESGSTVFKQNQVEMTKNVSVPSSSGNPVQPGEGDISVRADTSVSVPSSSGNPVQHDLPRAAHRELMSFQSPPHRGIRFNIAATA